MLVLLHVWIVLMRMMIKMTFCVCCGCGVSLTTTVFYKPFLLLRQRLNACRSITSNKLQRTVLHLTPSPAARPWPHAHGVPMLTAHATCRMHAEERLSNFELFGSCRLAGYPAACFPRVSFSLQYCLGIILGGVNYRHWGAGYSCMYYVVQYSYSTLETAGTMDG